LNPLGLGQVDLGQESHWPALPGRPRRAARSIRPASEARAPQGEAAARARLAPETGFGHLGAQQYPRVVPGPQAIRGVAEASGLDQFFEAALAWESNGAAHTRPPLFRDMGRTVGLGFVNGEDTRLGAIGQHQVVLVNPRKGPRDLGFPLQACPGGSGTSRSTSGAAVQETPSARRVTTTDSVPWRRDANQWPSEDRATAAESPRRARG
jgi:hypothetical protein